MGLAGVWLGDPVTARAQQPAMQPLKWDSMAKSMTPAPGLPKADFVFSVTNVSDAEVVIERAQPSCGCTVAQLPAQPWHLAPGAHGEIPVSVDLAGKTGDLVKTVTVVMATLPPEVLTVSIHIPDARELTRGMNQQMAVADRQAVFKGDCASCHVDKARGKMGKELYVEACGICHEAKPRATMVPDLHTMVHPNDYAYWKMMITIGKPGTLMPGFGEVAGGPLTDEQIDSLATTLTKVFPGDVHPQPSPMIRTNVVSAPTSLQIRK
jgi:mono/diheme cytochrome c family protein